jgi:hypothetical protein
MWEHTFVYELRSSRSFAEVKALVAMGLRGNISVSHRGSVALLDSFVGPKA